MDRASCVVKNGKEFRGPGTRSALQLQPSGKSGLGDLTAYGPYRLDKLLVGKSIWAAQAQRHGLECDLTQFPDFFDLSAFWR